MLICVALMAASCVSPEFRGRAEQPADYFARNWTTDDGLPHNSVSSVVQDSAGFIWLATAGGLARFDGNRFKEIPLPAEFRTEGYNIRGFLEEEPGTLLVLPTNGQVVRLRDGEFSMHPVSNELGGRQPLELFVDREKALWLGFRDGGLLRWREGESRWFGKEDGLGDRTTRFSFAIDADGATWIASGPFLARYEAGGLAPSKVTNGEPTVIASDRHGVVWACTPRQMLQLSRNRVVPVLFDPPWKSGIGLLQRHYSDRDGYLWFACGRLGLFRWDGEGLVRVETGFPIVLSITQDREGSLWVSTAGSGLGLLNRKSCELVDSHSGLTEDVSNAVVQDSTGAMWLANNSGGIYRQNGGRFEPLGLSLDGRPLYLSTLGFDDKGRLWCGGNTGLYRAEPPFTGHPVRMPVPERNLHLLHLTRNGDIWFASANSQFGFYRGDTATLLGDEEGYQGQTVRAIAEDRTGRIWAGTFGGELLCFEDGKLATFSAEEGLNGQPIHSLLPDDEFDALWIATAGGLMLWHEGKFKNITKEQGLADELIGHMLADGQGRLWLNSRSGLYHVTKAELFALAEGREKRIFSHRVGRSEGLPSISPRYNYHPSSVKSRDGRLWFTTSKGVVAVTPRGLEEELPVPSVFVDEARVNGLHVDVRSPIEIPAGPHRIDFDLAALSYVVPENLLLRHQLEGADPDWVETPQHRSTSYSGLAPGEYRLRLAAARQAGNWIESRGGIAIKVLPFWWDNPWIQFCALAAVVTGIVIGVRKWSQRQLRHRLLRLEQERALDRERSRIARDLHDELGGSLTEANFLIERLRNVPSEELAGGLEAVASRIRHLNMELATIVWTVSPANSSLDQLASFIRRHGTRFFKHTQVTCMVNEKTPIPPLPLNPEVQHNLLAIAKESFNNALKHAHASNVTLEMAFSDDTFHMVVTDDGRGFETDVQPDSQGNGLNNMKSRAEEIGAIISIVSSPGRGTTVRLSHPCFPSAAAALRAAI